MSFEFGALLKLDRKCLCIVAILFTIVKDCSKFINTNIEYTLSTVYLKHGLDSPTNIYAMSPYLAPLLKNALNSPINNIYYTISTVNLGHCLNSTASIYALSPYFSPLINNALNS